MVSGDRREAAAADCPDAGALRLHPSMRLGIVGFRHELLLACAHLERERSLAGLRKQLLRLESVADLLREPEPVEAAGGEDDGVTLTGLVAAEDGSWVRRVTGDDPDVLGRDLAALVAAS